jgi:hypothetical protein
MGGPAIAWRSGKVRHELAAEDGQKAESDDDTCETECQNVAQMNAGLALPCSFSVQLDRTIV